MAIWPGLLTWEVKRAHCPDAPRNARGRGPVMINGSVPGGPEPGDGGGERMSLEGAPSVAAGQRPLYERIERSLTARIADGEWAPGFRLPAERDLARQFNCSRVTVAKAIAKLQSRGLVCSRQGGGTYVAARVAPASNLFDDALLLTPRDLQELIEFRVVLEKEIGRLAADRIDADGLQILNNAVERMREHLEDASAFVSADVDFHLALARASGNRLLAAVYERTQELLRRQMLTGASYPGSMTRAIEAHSRIVHALGQHSVERVVACLLVHLHDAAEEVAGADLAVAAASGIPGFTDIARLGGP